MTNKEKFLALVSNEKTDTLEKNRERIKNRSMLRESQKIAIKVLMKLDELGWSQKDLATKLEVSPQQVTKIVSGKENLTIETQIKLQTILDIPVLATYYENKMTAIEEKIVSMEKHVECIIEQAKTVNSYQQATETIKMNPRKFSQVQFQYAA